MRGTPATGRRDALAAGGAHTPLANAQGAEDILPPGTPLLEAAGLQLAAGGRCLLRGLDLRLQAGQCWALLGPNGAGKTRLIETLAGIHAPRAGTVRCQGDALARLPLREAARRRALLPQQSQDAFDTTVFALACSGRHPWLEASGWESAQDRAVVMAALQAFELDGLADRPVPSLSGGERQRLALATVLAQQAPLMLLDEPLNHLDLRQQQRVMATLLGHARQLQGSLLCSLHDLTLTQQTATHVVLLDGQGGHVCGSRDEVMTRPHLEHAFGTRLACVRHEGRWHWLPLQS